MLRQHPEMVAQVGLLDPVVFLLFLPDVCFNFLHKELKDLPLAAAGLKCFVSREMGISHTLRRSMW